ncbi:MAG: YfiR family protein [Deltaproteobacteria bacterium]|nr:YfiR family protein [Deltaproteobacteria bacterium]
MNPTPRKIVKLLFSIILILFWTTLPSVSSSQDLDYVPKHKITALYLFNFLLFVDWPEEAVSNSSTLKVAIYGDSQLYEAMYLLAGKKIRGKKVAVFSLTKPEALDDSFQVLFVGGEDTQAVRELLKRVNGKPILTVSDRKGFVGLGGMVLFKDPEALRRGGKNEKRFIINLSAVRKSSLKVRSRLLRMSDIVYDLDPANLKTGE